MMGVLRHWSDEKVAKVAERLGTPTAQRRDDVRRVLNEADAIPAEQLRGAVHLTDEERERVLWWLHKPVPPGPMKALDERIIRKLMGRYAKPSPRDPSGDLS